MLPKAQPSGFSREVIPFQPRPILTRVVHFRVLGWWVTAVMRHWRPGESGPEGRCRLCRRCMAYRDGCLTVVGGKLDAERAAMLSIVNRPVQGER